MQRHLPAYIYISSPRHETVVFFALSCSDEKVTAGCFDPVTEVVTPCPGHARWLLDFGLQAQVPM